MKNIFVRIIKFFGGKSGNRVSRSMAGDILIALLLLFVSLFMVIPFVYAIMQALKPMNEIFIFPPRFFVRNPSFENFRNLVKSTSNLWVPFSRYFANSVFITVLSTFGQVALCSMAAFAFSKGRIRYRKQLFILVTTALLFSANVTSVPAYVVLSTLGLINSPFAIILPALAAPLGLFLMKQYMEGVPDAIIESGRVDGANPFVIFYYIIMPMVKPAWLTLIIFSFKDIWNKEGIEFIYSEQLKVLPTMLRQLSASGISRSGVAAAAAVLLMLPPIITFVIAQSKVIDTMSHSGIK